MRGLEVRDEPRVLLTVSGVIPKGIKAAVANGMRPRADYLELSRAMKADILDFARAKRLAPRLGAIVERFGGKVLLLAYVCWALRRRYDVIFTDGEQVGLPLAAMFKLTRGPRPVHAMIVHILSTRKKIALVDLLSLHRFIDRFVVYCTFQENFIAGRWGVDRDRILLTPFMVDDEFFSPERVVPSKRARPLLCAVGLERRDYATLLRAVNGLDVDVVVAAASPWSKQKAKIDGGDVPDNVTIRKFDQRELRQLYADAEFLVMPLEPVEFQAGITAILEAMAMGKPVLCTRTPGQIDVIQENVNGGYVEPEDPTALREKILSWLAAPGQVASFGTEARRLVKREMSLDCYTRRLARIVQESEPIRGSAIWRKSVLEVGK